MKTKNKKTVKVENTAPDKGYERQIAIEKLMSKMKHESLINHDGYMRYASTEGQFESDEPEDLRFFRCR